MKRYRLFLLCFFISGCAGAPTYPPDALLKNCSKKVTVIMDKTAESYLKLENITLKAWLELTNKHFADDDIDISYNASTIDILRINNFKEAKKTAKQKLLNNSDVVLFLTSDESIMGDRVRGFAYSRFFTYIYLQLLGIRLGNGFIIIFIRTDTQNYVEKISKVLMHEQAHLYDIRHSNDENSVMYYLVDHVSSHFDNFSKEKLKKMIQKDKKCVISAP